MKNIRNRKERAFYKGVLRNCTLLLYQCNAKVILMKLVGQLVNVMIILSKEKDTSALEEYITMKVRN